MNGFLILQVLFDAVVLFGFLFLFHFSVNQTRRKKEDLDVLRNVQIQEMKEGLQELLLTLKQLGKEVSDTIQDEVREAEEKTEVLKKVLLKVQKDLAKVQALSEEVNSEKERLESKMDAIRTAKKTIQKSSPVTCEALSKDSYDADEKNLRIKNSLTSKRGSKNGRGQAVGFSSVAVREIYRLADGELGIDEIVHRTKLSRAEVQLILNLRGNRFTTPN